MDSIRYSRDIPLRYECDVAVLGGGIAGVSAAAAAARSGARVILVERFATLGGMITTGGVHNLCGESAGNGEFFDELLAGMEAFNAIRPYEPYRHFESGNRPFHGHVMMLVLQELLCSRGVKLLLHTRFVDVCRDDDGRIDACVLRGQSGPEALRAKQYIDTTGEAEVAHLSGSETMKGRERDGLQLPMSLMWFLRHLDPDQMDQRVPEGWFERFERQQDLPMVSPWPHGPNANAIKVKVSGYDSTDTESLSAAEIAGRRRMMAVLDYFQRVDGKPWYFDHASPIMGIREGRRVRGDYVLTESDVRSGRSFDDGVAVGTFYLDAHEPTTDKRVAQIADRRDRMVPPYQIPLRALRARDSGNLWMAGRCMSADLLALSSARVSTSSSMMGQAVGIAAALAANAGCPSDRLDPADVREQVLARGGVLER